MSQNNCRQTPWATFGEWNTVRRYLFPSSTDTAVADVTSADRATIERINRGLHRVAVWECRGRVPLAVQITAQLLRLKISDSLAEAAPSGALSGGVEDRTQIIRLAYAMAVIRLVNGVVEPEQRTKGYAASVSDIAFRCGLPRWFVDLRHDATHTSLPSLSTLRLAADTGLSWLQSRYWDSQAAHLEAEPMRVRSLMSEAAALTDQIQTSTSWIKKKEGNQKKKKKKKKRKRATQQTTAIETAPSTTASTSDAALTKLSEPETSAHARQANFDRVMQHITQSTGPTMVRDVIVPALVNQTDGLLLLHNRERFGVARMRAILARWHEFLESMQQAWPYFYGCLCTGVAEYLLLPQIVQDEETIVDATAQNLFVPRRSVEEESLVWWLEALLDMLLGARHWVVADYDVASIAMATSAVAVVMTSATTRPKKKKKSRHGARARISMDDVSRLGGCASHVHARRIYGKRLFERLLETCKRGHDLDQEDTFNEVV